MRQLPTFLLATLISCAPSYRQADGVTSDKKEADFETLLTLFENRLTKIPDNFVRQYLQVDSVKFETGNVWTYEVFKFSNDLTGLVYKASCTAGGGCESLVLVMFDKQRNKIEEMEIGHNYSDYGSSSELKYALDGNRIEFRLRETEVLEAADGTDKEQVTVDTTYFYIVDLTTGQIGRE